MGSRNQQRAKIDGSNPFAKRPTISGLTDSLIESEPGSVLAVAEDGSIQLGLFTLTAKGLITETGVSFDEWQQLGKILQRFEASIQWLIGDWMAYGERVWGQTYEQVAEETGYNVKSLYQYAWVSRNVDFSIRIENLSFGHHVLVAGLEPEQQRQWLEYALSGDLSISQLRQAMTVSPPTPSKQRGLDALFSSENKRRIKRLFSLGIKAGQGDQRAREKALSQIAEVRRWLDELERGLQD
jgi:hypothetical protein